MSGMGFVEVDYLIHFTDTDAEPARVRGVQVGRFAIRNAQGDDRQITNWPSVEHLPWRVEHIPTGVAIAAFDSFDDAYALADDISRFSKNDPASRDPGRVRVQMGEQVVGWLKHIRRPFARGESPVMTYIPFREWLTRQGREWKPRRRKAKTLFGR